MKDMEELFNDLRELIVTSMIQVDEKYFNFKIANKKDLIHRERVYCYELYHQMRNLQNEMKFNNYSINAEPDKSNHPILKEFCGSINPDFIVHNPGYMSHQNNLAVIEVKASSGNLTIGIKKDLQTINCMTGIEEWILWRNINYIWSIIPKEKKQSRIKNNLPTNAKKFIIILQEEPNEKPEILI